MLFLLLQRENTAVSDTLSSRQGELPPPHTCRMSLNQGQPIATLTHTSYAGDPDFGAGRGSPEKRAAVPSRHQEAG